MESSIRQRFVFGLLVWLLGSLTVYTILDILSLVGYFVSSLVGLIVMTEFVAPLYTKPKWYSRLRWMIMLGMVAFGWVFVSRVMKTFPT